MKIRNIIITLLLVFIFPIIAEAKSCMVVSGTGNGIGDEIACGSEHFYILEKVDNTVKMIAKYNLYVGDKIDRDSESFLVSSYDDAPAAEYAAYLYCESLKTTYGEENVETTQKYSIDGDPTEYFCRIYTPLEYSEVKQNELAIGLYPNGNMEAIYPIYGSVYLDEEVGEKEFDDNLDMIPETSQFNTYLSEYKNTLANIGVNVLDIGFIKRSGVENFINSVSDKKITIPTYNPNDLSINPEDSMWNDGFYRDYFIYNYKFNIKEYVPEKYNWLYGTSYWVGSATVDDYDNYFDEFLSTIGDYCSYSRGCHYTKMGVGLRPVISIDSNDIALPEEKKIANPDTGDNMSLYVICGVLSTILLITSTLYVKRNNY